MPVLAGKWRSNSIAASNPPAEPPIPTIGQRPHLPPVNLLLGARRALEVVTARRRIRCFFAFALGGTCPVIVAHINSVLQTKFGPTNIHSNENRDVGGRFYGRWKARSQAPARNPGADLGASPGTARTACEPCLNRLRSLWRDRSRLLRGRRRPDAGQTFLDQIALNLPVFER